MYGLERVITTEYEPTSVARVGLAERSVLERVMKVGRAEPDARAPDSVIV